MRAIILAAGRGTRISRYLAGKPKCTVNIGDEILIEYTIKLLKKRGIDKIAVILGYGGNTIRDILKKYNIDYYENPFFDVTNSIASLWFARDFLCSRDDYIIMNGDVYIEEELLDDILFDKKSPVMFADGSRKECADYKFKYTNNILEKYGKELEGDDISGEYIGIGKFDKGFVDVFTARLADMISKQEHDVWWENVIYNMVGERDVYVTEIKNRFWAEVDYIEDYERILKFRGYKANFELNVTKDNI